MPRPIGWRPSVMMTSICRLSRCPTYSKSLRSDWAASIWRTFAVGPTGMSINKCVEPAATFLDKIDATICPRESIPSGRSTEIKTSSAGESPACPPHARQPRCSRTISWSRPSGKSTSQRTSMVSAVPAGEVIARLEVLGTNMPCAARIGTNSIDVRLPGIPPIQCLSATSVSRQLIRCPLDTIACVR